MTDTTQKHGGRGGRRAGAGRPPTTYRQIRLDTEAAQELRELVTRWRTRTPEAHWTARSVLAYLITNALWREDHRE